MSAPPAEENPYLVLDLGPEADAIEAERAAQRLLGLLELGAESAKTFSAPRGIRARDSEMVRAALSTFRDPVTRLTALLWLVPGDTAAEKPVTSTESPDTANSHADAFRAIGWRGRCT